MRSSFYKPFITIFIAGLLCFFQSVECIHAADCEILSIKKYDKELRSIITDWHEGIPYRKYQLEMYPCAFVTVRNNSGLSISTEDIEITATFTDNSTAQKKFVCKNKNLDVGKSIPVIYASRANSQSLLWNVHLNNEDLPM